MRSAHRFRLFLCTCSNLEEAERIARALVEAKLAACVNLLPGVQSIYRWKGAVETEGEILLMGKTSAESMEKVEEAITALHSYEVPEILAFEIAESGARYLDWLEGSLS